MLNDECLVSVVTVTDGYLEIGHLATSRGEPGRRGVVNKRLGNASLSWQGKTMSHSTEEHRRARVTCTEYLHVIKQFFVAYTL